MAQPTTSSALTSPSHSGLHNRIIDVGNMYGTSAANVAAAFAAATAGDTLYFEDGTYEVSVSVASISGLTLRGTRGAVLQNAGGATNPTFLIFTDCDDLTIENLSFDMNGVQTFGGVKVAESVRTTVQNCRFYDSAFDNTNTSDHFGLILNGNPADPATDFQIRDNHFEYCQMELDYVKRGIVSGNISQNAWHTAAFGIFTTTGTAATIEDIIFTNNVAIDANASAGAFCLSNDPTTDTDNTIRRIQFIGNTVIFTGASTPKRAFLIGTTDNSSVASGNVFQDITVKDNLVVYMAGTFSDAAIFFNAGANSAFVFNRCQVIGNHLYGPLSGSDTGINLRYFQNGLVKDNVIANFTATIATDSNNTGTHYEVLYETDGSGTGFVWGGDTNLYRSAANTLKTDDGLLVTGDLELDAALNHDGTTVGFYGVTPATRPTAYTQTYSTADKTHAAPTAAALTVADGAGTNDGTIGAITGDASVIAAVQELADQINKLIVDVADTKQVVNSVIDDLQTLGLLQ